MAVGDAHHNFLFILSTGHLRNSEPHLESSGQYTISDIHFHNADLVFGKLGSFPLIKSTYYDGSPQPTATEKSFGVLSLLTPLIFIRQLL